MARSSRDRRIANWIKGCTVALVCLVGVGACVATTLGADNSTAIPAPDATERADTVTLLARASAAQDVCYGWRLRDGYGDEVNTGSNLGDGVPVQSDPVRCRRWIEVIADVTYTSASSELNDWAVLRVAATEDLATSGFVAGLDRLGVDPDAVVDEPGWAVCRAAVFLPLLAAEAGLVPPEPTEAPEPTVTPAALPDTASDLLRDRWPYLLGAVSLSLVTVVLLAIGWFERRHQRQAGIARRPGGGVVPGRRP
jgi:hypothetical protein